MTTLRSTQITIALALAVLAGGECATAQSRRTDDDAGVMRDGRLLAIADSADPSLAPEEWGSIKRIIGNQLTALRNGDATRAFSYASAGIRDQFDDATTFLLMVKQRYGVLLTARYTEFLEGAVIDGHTIQPLRLVMNDDTVLVAIYEMQRDGRGTWRIAGCVIAPSTVRST